MSAENKNGKWMLHSRRKGKRKIHLESPSIVMLGRVISIMHRSMERL